MILSLQAFAPAAILLVGGIALLARPGRLLYLLVQLAALATLVRLALLATVALKVPAYDILPDLPLQLRLDSLSLFFALAAVGGAVVPALALAGSRREPPALGWICLAEFGAVAAILSANLQGLAAGWGLYAVSLLMLIVLPQAFPPLLRRPSGAETRHVVVQLAAAVLLLAGAATVDALAGTAAYDAVPVGSVDTRAQLLLAAAPAVSLAAIAALVRACRRPLPAAMVLVSATLPLAAYTLSRTVDLAEGRPLNPVIAGLVIFGAGAGALAFGLYATWAPDLGAAVARLLNASGLLLVAGYAVGGGPGMVAVIAGFLALDAVAAANLLVLDASGGRLPGRGRLRTPALAVIALLPLAALGGLYVGFSLDARLLLGRGLVGLGPWGLAMTVLLAAGCLAILSGSLAAGRFGGGALNGGGAVFEALLAIAAVAGMGLAAEPLLAQVSRLVAGAVRAPAADVQAAAVAAVPGTAVAAGLEFALIALLLVAGLTGEYTAADGLRRAPDILPPRLSVVPEIAGRRLLRHAVAQGRRAIVVIGEHPRLAVTATWAAALLAVAFVGR